MSSVGEPQPNPHLTLIGYVREIDRQHIAFCPINLSDDEIVDFSVQNRDKKLRISCVDFDKPLRKLYQGKSCSKIIVFVSFLCFDEATINESMTLFDVFDTVFKNNRYFLSKVMYRIYTNMIHFSAKDTVIETIQTMANEFAVLYQKDPKTNEYPPEANHFFDKPIYERPKDWFSSPSK